MAAAMTDLPRSMGGELPISRRCFDLNHGRCPGEWTQYPDLHGTCECDCHNGPLAKTDCRIVSSEPSGTQIRFYCSCGWFGPDWRTHAGLYPPARHPRTAAAPPGRAFLSGSAGPHLPV